MPVYIEGRPASMVADSRAFDARHCKSERENWTVLRDLNHCFHFGTRPGAASGCT